METSARQQLMSLIQQWNENRLDLFNLSFPDENDEFHGVMRFYYQEPGEKVATKCVRVSSAATTIIVLEALITKFRPDLSNPPQSLLNKFSIWEVHENGDERKLDADEHPLIVQLTWHKDDREGRFLFKSNDKALIVGNISSTSADSSQTDELSRNSKRFSKRKKEKELRKKYQNQKQVIEGDIMKQREEEQQVSRRLYDEVPPTTFTRTISNPEAVMKKRREQKIENRLRQISKGGYVKIFSGDLDPSRPYVTLLVGAEDRAYKIIRDTLNKLGGDFDKAVTDDFCLVEITLPKSTNVSRSFTDLRQLDEDTTERFLHDDETPFFEFEGDRINHIFAIRKRPPGLRSIKHQLSAAAAHDTASISSSTGTGGSMYQQIAADYAFDPILVPLDSSGRPINEKAIPLRHGITEIGSDPRVSSFIIRDPSIRPKHCIINFSDGLVSVTPLDGILEVNGLRAESTQQLRDGFVLRIGGEHAFRFHLSQRQNLPSSAAANYANSPIFQRAAPHHHQHTERPKKLDLFKNDYDRKSITSFAPDSFTTTFDVMEETTFGVIDGQIMQRSKSTDALYQPPPLLLPLSSSTLKPSTTTIITPTKTVFTPRTIDRMLQTTSMRPPTHFPETTIQNLPAIIELYDHNVEDEFLHYLIFDKSYEIFSFRLTPAFMIYMVLRYRISPITYRQGISHDERRRYIVTFLDKTIERCFHIIHINSSNKSLLSFWLSNCSELLHIISADKEISTIIGDTVISKLKTTVEKCYDLLVETTRVGLQQPMSTFLKIDLNDETASEGVIRQLEELVQIIRKCHLNAALTIQLFSQLFYFISMYGFNWLVTTREGAFYLSRQFGLHLRTRLQYICQWAEKQGLELAAECHLDRLQQTVNLLTTPKTIDQIASLGATCYKLNSLQVKYLLENYVPEVGEPRATRDLIMEVVRLAESQADVMSKQDGFPIQLEENPQLHLSFVFPSDGYFVEDFKGIPPEMSDFIASLQAKGICRLIPQIGATGSWTIHMNKSNGYSHDNHSSTIGSSNGSTSYQPYSNNNNNNINGYQHPTSSQASTVRASPPTQQISLKRLPGDSIGLSIVAAQGIGDNHCGIYVKNVVANSAAHRDGRLEKGDQLLAVNDHSLIGITQEEAAKRISSAGSDVRFEVSKRAAYYNGIIDSLEKSTTPNTPASGYQPTSFPPQQPQQQPQQQQFHQPIHQQPIAEPILHRHTRSASTSELFANQSDNVSLASMTQNPHNIQSGSRLPAHYKVANRPAVVQPQRPYTGAQSPGPYRRAGAASPTPLYSQIVPSQQRSASTVPFNSSTMPKQNPTWLENYSNLPSIGETSYSRIPTAHHHGVAAAAASQYYSSNGSSPLPAPPLNSGSNHFTKIDEPASFSSSHQSHFPPASVKSQSKQPPSGRLSAPLFDHSTRSFVEPAILSVEALDRELDAIESKGSMMTLVDKERYHELLKKISELRGPAPLGQSRSTSDFIGANGVLRPAKDKQLRNPNFMNNGIEPQHRVSKPDYTLPFMTEMASKLESKKQQQQRPATLPKPDSLPTTSSTTQFSTTIQRPQISQTEKMIDDVSQQFDRISAMPLTPSTPSTSTAAANSGIRPAMRDNSVSPEDRSKKRVQFSDTIEDVKENNEEEDEEEDKREPIVVVGKHEVYNDPRQRRLNEIQQKSIKPAVDGAHLAFRDKMKMFAKQANETTPKDRQKTSSAQREIEQSTDSA